MKDDNAYVTQNTAQRAVGEVLSIRALVRAQLVPQDDRGYVHLGFVQRLAQFTRTNPPTRHRALVCLLEWLSANQPETIDRVSEVVAELLAAGKIVLLGDTAQDLGYHRETVRRWAQKGFMPGARVKCRALQGVAWGVRPCWVFIPEDVLRIKQVLYSLTIYEAAERLGVSVETADKMAKNGRIRATKTPVGWRFEATDIISYLVAMDQRGLPYQEALSLFGTSEAEFRAWVDSKRIATTSSGRTRTYDKESIIRAKSERERLRGDFAEWLPATIHDPTYAPKVVAKKLGVAKRTAFTWTHEGLLPYFDLGAPQKKKREQMLYVASYIDALALFAQSQQAQPSKELARTFKEYMQQLHTKQP